MYWEREQEIGLLTSILAAHAPVENDSAVDPIICDLIEMGLVDMDRAPRAQQVWQDEWLGFDVTREFVAKHYITEDPADLY